MKGMNTKVDVSLQEKVLMRGNEAVGEGAIRAGCSHYFGYPITPQNELFSYMAKYLPQAGGHFLQSESELAGINMVIGASAGGARCLTSSSGPGFTLLSEGLTSLAAAQLPAVVVCVSRAGPGLGRISSSQADYQLATKGGGHGDYQCIVLSPASVQELYELTVLAFDLADKYRNPVILLSDAILGQMMEPVLFSPEENQKAPFKSWAVQGKGQESRKVIKAAPHTDEELIQWNVELKDKYALMQDKEQRCELLYTDDAELLIAAFGSSARICMDGIVQARKEGMRVGLFRPVSVWPFPEDALDEQINSGTKRVLVVEANNGQMVHDIKSVVSRRCPVEHFGQGGGAILKPDEIYAKIKEAFQQASEQ
jgi:2-oxoglutarate ferredoxin oxidoreductase subunit alpha